MHFNYRASVWCLGQELKTLSDFAGLPREGAPKGDHIPQILNLHNYTPEPSSNFQAPENPIPLNKDIP